MIDFYEDELENHNQYDYIFGYADSSQGKILYGKRNSDEKGKDTILTIGMPGTGKSSCIISNNILQIPCNDNDSIVVISDKSSCVGYCEKSLRDKGFQVNLFDAQNQRSDYWNPIDGIEPYKSPGWEGSVRAFTEYIISDKNEEDDFWNQYIRTLLFSVIGLLMRKDKLHRLDDIADYLKEHKEFSSIKKDFDMQAEKYADFLCSKEKLEFRKIGESFISAKKKNEIVDELLKRLLLYCDDNKYGLLQKSTIDLSQSKLGKHAYFIVSGDNIEWIGGWFLHSYLKSVYRKRKSQKDESAENDFYAHIFLDDISHMPQLTNDFVYRELFFENENDLMASSLDYGLLVNNFGKTYADFILNSFQIIIPTVINPWDDNSFDYFLKRFKLSKASNVIGNERLEIDKMMILSKNQIRYNIKQIIYSLHPAYTGIQS